MRRPHCSDAVSKVLDVKGLWRKCKGPLLLVFLGGWRRLSRYPGSVLNVLWPCAIGGLSSRSYDPTYSASLSQMPLPSLLQEVLRRAQVHLPIEIADDQGTLSRVSLPLRSRRYGGRGILYFSLLRREKGVAKKEALMALEWMAAELLEATLSSSLRRFAPRRSSPPP